MHHKKCENQQAKCQSTVHTLQCSPRTMQSLKRTESQPQPWLWHRRQGHLPGNLSCSDYTMCLASLWAILPFCSVKYKRHSGKGKGLGKSGVWLTSLPRLNSLNQEPGISFTQDVSLAWGHGSTERQSERRRKKTAVLKKKKQIWQKHILSQPFFSPLFLLLVVLRGVHTWNSTAWDQLNQLHQGRRSL